MLKIYWRTHIFIVFFCIILSTLLHFYCFNEAQNGQQQLLWKEEKTNERQWYEPSRQYIEMYVFKKEINKNQANRISQLRAWVSERDRE